MPSFNSLARYRGGHMRVQAARRNAILIPYSGYRGKFGIGDFIWHVFINVP